MPAPWVNAGDLRIGDVLMLMDGRCLPVEENLVFQANEPVRNFSVEHVHS